MPDRYVIVLRNGVMDCERDKAGSDYYLARLRHNPEPLLPAYRIRKRAKPARLFYFRMFRKIIVPFALVIALSIIAISALAQDKPEGSWWDHPRVRACCSVADAVFADRWQVQPDGSVIATITEGTRQTAEWAASVIGKTYHVPADKVLDLPGNPTGRALLFISPATHGLYCFAYGPLI